MKRRKGGRKKKKKGEEKVSVLNKEVELVLTFASVLDKEVE